MAQKNLAPWPRKRQGEQRDIDFARASLTNVGGITEMLKIMAVCDTHRVGIVPHFTGPHRHGRPHRR